MEENVTLTDIGWKVCVCMHTRSPRMLPPPAVKLMTGPCGSGLDATRVGARSTARSQAKRTTKIASQIER